MENPAGRMKRKRHTRGETLVETIVAFSVLVVLITMVTTAVKSGVALNNRAISNMNKLYGDCANIELGTGLTAQPGGDMLTLTPLTEGTGEIQIPINVLRTEAGILTVFTTNGGDAAGEGGA